MSAAQVLFYCHFPDMLLATRSSRLRALYRAPIDALEQRTTGMVRALRAQGVIFCCLEALLSQAHTVVVNSKYTADVFARTFTRLHSRGMRPSVLYPAVALPPIAQLTAAPTDAAVAALKRAGVAGVPKGALRQPGTQQARLFG